jgi:hypothetical protein
MRGHTGYVVPAVLEDAMKGFFVYVYPTGWFERHCALFVRRKLPLIVDLDMCLIQAHKLVKGHMSDETGEVERDSAEAEWHCCDEVVPEHDTGVQSFHSFRWRLKKDWTALASPSTGHIFQEIKQLEDIENLRKQIDTGAELRYPTLRPITRHRLLQALR